jgi:hypothetical protein
MTKEGLPWAAERALPADAAAILLRRLYGNHGFARGSSSPYLV